VEELMVEAAVHETGDAVGPAGHYETQNMKKDCWWLVVGTFHRVK
jgi:hypothetical protein